MRWQGGCGQNLLEYIQTHEAFCRLCVQGSLSVWLLRSAASEVLAKGQRFGALLAGKTALMRMEGGVSFPRTALFEGRAVVLYRAVSVESLRYEKGWLYLWHLRRYHEA